MRTIPFVGIIFTCYFPTVIFFSFSFSHGNRNRWNIISLFCSTGGVHRSCLSVNYSLRRYRLYRGFSIWTVMRFTRIFGNRRKPKALCRAFEKVVLHIISWIKLSRSNQGATEKKTLELAKKAESMDHEQWLKAGTGVIPKTFSYDPTKVKPTQSENR